MLIVDNGNSIKYKSPFAGNVLKPLSTAGVWAFFIGGAMETYQCIVCQKELPLTEFYKEKSKKGHTHKCRSCLYEYNKIWRKENPDLFRAQREKYRKRHRENERERRELNRDIYRERSRRSYQENKQEMLKYYREYRITNKYRERARGIIKNRLKSGKIIKSNYCSVCNKSENIQAHHDDYSKPLEVIWLCASCHGLLHKGVA